MRVRTTLGVLAACAIILLAAAPARAQTDEPPLPGQPAFTDGVWMAYMASSGTVGVGEASGDRVMAGSGMISVADGLLSGEYSVSGSYNFTAPEGASGSSTSTTTGAWGGTAAEPGFIDGNTHIEGTVTVNGVTQPMSFDFPSTGTLTVIPIISATCTVVVGDLDYVENTALSEAGASPNLHGTFVAVRLVDAMPGDEPPSGWNEALDLNIEGLTFWANAVSSGEVNYAELDSLLTRAEDLYERLERAAACGIGNEGSWLGLLSAMVFQLLQAAVDNPGLFDNMELLRLISAGVRMGLIGSGAAAGADLTELQAKLADDITSRAEEAEEERDCDGAIALALAGALVGDALFTGGLVDSVAVACGGG